MNHALMYKKRDQKCSLLQKKDQKEGRGFIQPIMVPVDGLCYKIVQLIHQFFKKTFHLSENIYHETEKKQVKRMHISLAKIGSFSYYDQL